MEGVEDGRRLVELGERALELGNPSSRGKVGNTTAAARQPPRIPRVSRPATSSTAPHSSAVGWSNPRRDDLVDISKAFMIGKLPPQPRRRA